MAYVSLYRKYRPQSFGEVVGQRHVTQTLAHAVDEDRLHHAYLFTGPRGTGKTSTARILAKAVNCEKGPTSEPCQVCENCVSITEGRSVDVIELDMASHGGVDDARELRERALFSPARTRRKVYILDEVHMASNAAFNALLKLVEEPPGHVLFAMATTEPQKVIPTIMSRVQRLDLRSVPSVEVAEHVRRIAGSEAVTIDDAAVEAIVRAGDGSIRDTLSVLDQVLSFAGREVTGTDVAQMLGHTPTERTHETVSLLASRDLAGLFALVQGLLDDGHDLRRYTLDLVGHLRDLLVTTVAPDRPDLVDAPDDRRAQLLEQRSLVPRETLVRAIGILGDTLTEMRRGPARLPLERALATLALPAVAGDAGALADRVARLEGLLAGGAPAQTPSAEARPSPAATREAGADAPQATEEPAAAAPPAAREESSPAAEEVAAAPVSEPAAPVAEEAPDPAPETTAADPEPGGDADIADVQRNWRQVLERVKGQSPVIHAYYSPAVPIQLSGGALVLGYPARFGTFHAVEAVKPKNIEALQGALVEVCGLQVQIRAEVTELEDGHEPAPEPPAEDATDALDSDAEGPSEVDQDDAAALLREHLGAQVVEREQA